MAASITQVGESIDRALVVERIFDAPRSLVFSAWIEPQHLLRWFGPRGFTVPSYTLDPQPGGSWRVCMVSPDGVEHWVRGSFREILEPERLAFIEHGPGADERRSPRHEPAAGRLTGLVQPGQPDPEAVPFGIERVRVADVGDQGAARDRGDRPGPPGQPPPGRDDEVSVGSAAEH